ncbi:MAG: alkaline phosphatase [Bacteroidia bacterium]|nr:alkaline phosphatase [Bacteroidia bacterium]
MQKLHYLTLFLLIIAFNFNSFSQKRPKPKNVILMIGDGMGLAQICAGMVYREGDLNLSRFKKIGLIKTNSSDDYVTDSAAGATAFSIGKKTFNGAIGVDSLKKPQATILELAEKNNLSTGMVVTCAITHATPGSFIAHVDSRKKKYEIAKDFTKTDIDVVIGGGMAHFTKRPDKINLIDTLIKNNYTVYDSTYEIDKIKSNKFYKFTNNYHLPKMSEGRGNYSENASMKAIETLCKNKKGFFLMIEGSQIDWGSHDTSLSYTVNEMLDFDNAIGKVLDWAEKDGNTLVIITADHETGGLSLTGGSLKDKKLTGKFSTTEHTGIMVPVFAYGPGSDNFTGIYENTDIFHKITKLLDIK